MSSPATKNPTQPCQREGAQPYFSQCLLRQAQHHRGQAACGLGAASLAPYSPYPRSAALGRRGPGPGQQCNASWPWPWHPVGSVGGWSWLCLFHFKRVRGAGSRGVIPCQALLLPSFVGTNHANSGKIKLSMAGGRSTRSTSNRSGSMSQRLSATGRRGKERGLSYRTVLHASLLA